mmetsp:Transcript_31561/g.97610  ORF Transcript_31561/g.97610 Transcript_31561/m.97610 type:complete len:142 (-) Transcript_31561:20-445(-)
MGAARKRGGGVLADAAVADASLDAAVEARLRDFDAEATFLDTVSEGIERHPTMLRAAASRTKELLKDEREMLDDDSLAARAERFLQGLVRHPAMLWGTFLRVTELMEEELVEAGDKDSLAKAESIRQVRIAAEAVRESRQL